MEWGVDFRGNYKEDGLSKSSETYSGTVRPKGPKKFLAGGFIFAAMVILLSLSFLRSDRPVLWPPLSVGLVGMAFTLLGTAIFIVLLALLYLAMTFVAAAIRKKGWREFVETLVYMVVTAAIVCTSISVSLKVFYWPWATSSAVETILANTEKWRTVASAETIADHYDGEIKKRLEAGLASKSPAVQVAAAYAMAVVGEKGSLRRLGESAAMLPAARADSQGIADGNNIASVGDAAWLLATICDDNSLTIEELRQYGEPGQPRIVWDEEKRVYRKVQSDTSLE